MKNDITVGDLVEEVGTDSGWWVVTEIFRNTLRQGFAAKLALKDRPDCVTFVPIDRLAKVG
jgi:hypothetical protein